MKNKIEFFSMLLICLHLAPRCGPYVDTSSSTTMAKLPQMRSVGLNGITFAFVLAGGGGCTPKWNGNVDINDPSIVDPIKHFTSSGGDCSIAFGGANGPYLENSCTTSDQLANAYKQAIDASGCNHIDLDFESWLNNIDMVNKAISSVQQTTGCTVSYTLAADENGLNSLGKEVLNSAKEQGVNVNIVNPMCFDFRPSGSVGDSTINCAKAVYNNMAIVWTEKSRKELYSMLGVTTMIGIWDSRSIFTLDDSKQLVQWAQLNKIGHLGFWSLNRDNGDCPGSEYARGTCSGISQNEWDFTRTILPFCGKHVSPWSPIQLQIIQALISGILLVETRVSQSKSSIIISNATI